LNCADADNPASRHMKNKNFFIIIHLVIEKIAAENYLLSSNVIV
jgi:hypothetical protein